MQDVQRQQENFFKEIIKFSIVALLIVIPVRFFVAQPFIVSGASMQPTFETGEYLIVDQLTYQFETPERGDVIIFKYPKDPSKYFIKRVIGLPGETIRIQGENVYIVNSDHPSGFILNESYVSTENLQGAGTTEVKLGESEYFVLGDNRKASSDSRIWGPLEDKYIVGRAFVRLFPVQHSEFFPGDYQSSSYEN